MVHFGPRMGSSLPKLQGVEVGLTYRSAGKGLCQPNPPLRIQSLHGRALSGPEMFVLCPGVSNKYTL